MTNIPFNLPYTCTESGDNVAKLVHDPHLLNGYDFTRRCASWFEAEYPGYRAFMTTSCTRALELAALALDIRPGDEVIMPSYNFVGVADAFANYGAKLVLLDIDPATMNIDAGLLECAITPRTRAVVVMHYSGVACEIEAIAECCEKHGVVLIEDNAQGLGATLNGRKLGSFGDFSCVSFDRMKNISAGEGGVLLCRPEFTDAVDVAFEKGTNKSDFIKGKAPAYEWIARGSNFSISEYNAAILLPLLEKSGEITAGRLSVWNTLYEAIRNADLPSPALPPLQYGSGHNAHIFFLKFGSRGQRDHVMASLQQSGVPAYFHYTPLHHSILGRKYLFHHTGTDLSERDSGRLLRLPMHNFLQSADICQITEALVLAVKVGAEA